MLLLKERALEHLVQPITCFVANGKQLSEFQQDSLQKTQEREASERRPTS